MSVERLHVVIVNYKTSDLAIRCVHSLLEFAISSADRIVIVDNASPDDSVSKLRQALPDVTVIESPSNGGFGSGVNLGAAALDSEYFLVLNPDTFFTTNSVRPVLNLMDQHPDVALVGLDLLNSDGSRQYSARRFYALADILSRRLKFAANLAELRLDRHLMKNEWAAKTPFDAEWVMGTGFIVRSEVFWALGGMDDRYFLYMEDLDLCARIWNSGRRVWGVPGAHLFHDHQRASAKGLSSLYSRAGREHIRSLIIFARKFTLPMFKPPGTEEIVKAYRRSGFNARKSPRTRSAGVAVGSAHETNAAKDVVDAV